MASYLLLRDNKESGPFTLDELLHHGLKPYDLIWIKEKSAAWRYPSEIGELKAFAPAVEEQPFDRFYKKTSDEPEKDQAPAHDPELERFLPQPRTEEPAYTPRKSVFVTLPGQKQVAATKNPEAVRKDPIPEPKKGVTPVTITENPEAAEIKYSQPLDEIKERYVKTLLERKDKKAKKGILLSGLKKASVFGGLIVVGVLAGYMIRTKPSATEAENDKVPQVLQSSPSLINGSHLPDQEENIISSGIDQASFETPVDNAQARKSIPDVEKFETTETEKQTAPITIRKETMMIVPKRKEDFERPGPGAGFNSITGERERRTRSNDHSNDLPSSGHERNNLEDLVSVASNDYKRVAFGGIRNLHLTVTNNSKFELDNVIVELQYLKPSEETLRTENIRFSSIGPNASSTIRVPDTNRGIKVNYRIINIDSRQTTGTTSGM